MNNTNKTDKLGKNGRLYLSKSTLLNNSNNVFVAVHVNGNQIAYQYYGDTGLGKCTCLFGSPYVLISDAPAWMLRHLPNDFDFGRLTDISEWIDENYSHGLLLFDRKNKWNKKNVAKAIDLKRLNDYVQTEMNV